MSAQFFAQPILNSPYEYPKRHWRLDESGQPTQTIDEGRRAASFVTPIPKPSKQSSAAQQSLALDAVSDDSQQYDTTGNVNEMRRRVDAWRAIPNPKDWGVTPETARLLQHWRSHNFGDIRPFFCQVEAAETMIWLTEVAPKTQYGRRLRDMLANASNDANPDLLRCALKLATGAGKTTVMAMIIAWQTVNAIRRPASNLFTSGFLVVTPGITIRDRLRVLQPNDPDNYYANRELLPPDMLRDIAKAKIVITNYHAFKPRERLNVAKASRRLLQGRRGGEPDTLETEGQMIRRVMPDLMGMRRVMALNDEGHHCYRAKAGGDEEPPLMGDDKHEATKNNESARVWISGLEAVHRNIGVSQVVDLSATPFFLRGSGYAEGTLFPWTVCDFSLMDAIECGIVKLPRVPVSENIPGGDMPMYRALWEHIRSKMPRRGRGNNPNLDPRSIPNELRTALNVLYGHYAKTHAQWEQAGIPTPPCFAIVCNNTATSKLVYDYVSGFERKLADGSTTFVKGELELFSNFNEHGNPHPLPRALLIDSEQLESGDALDKNFRKIASAEIERFRKDIVARTGDRAQADSITDQDLLREVMNTVGKEGRLGAGIRCVVSVSMLTEGWDANNVTHILGVRAFGTQLLCEQVIGRALRRQSYEINDDGLFDVEYADVLGVPFDFTAQPVDVTPQIPRRATQVRAISPDRDHLEIRFPRVTGYRVDPPRENLTAHFTEDSKLTLSPELVGPTRTQNQGIVGEGVELNLEHLKETRQSTLLMTLTKHLIQSKYQDRDDIFPSHLYGQMRLIVKRWLDEYLTCVGGTDRWQLMYPELADMACERIDAAIVRAHYDDRKVIAALDPFNPWGSTAFVNFATTRQLVWHTDAQKCHLNLAVLDSHWEGEFCRVVERHPKTLAYVKNHNLGLEIPYSIGGIPRSYIPDFIVQIDDKRGADNPLNLIVEVKGYRREDAKAKHDAMATYWIPAVNALAEYGRWAFAEFTNADDMQDAYGRLVSAAITKSKVAESIAANPSVGTLADYLRPYIGRIHDSNMSARDIDKVFTEVLNEKFARHLKANDPD